MALQKKETVLGVLHVDLQHELGRDVEPLRVAARRAQHQWKHVKHAVAGLPPQPHALLI